MMNTKFQLHVSKVLDQINIDSLQKLKKSYPNDIFAFALIFSHTPQMSHAHVISICHVSTLQNYVHAQGQMYWQVIQMLVEATSIEFPSFSMHHASSPNLFKLPIFMICLISSRISNEFRAHKYATYKTKHTS